MVATVASAVTRGNYCRFTVKATVVAMRHRSTAVELPKLPLSRKQLAHSGYGNVRQTRAFLSTCLSVREAQHAHPVLVPTKRRHADPCSDVPDLRRPVPATADELQSMGNNKGEVKVRARARMRA